MIFRNLNIVGGNGEDVDINISNEKINMIKPAGSLSFAKEETDNDFRDCIVFPGLINSHDHLEFNLYPMLGHRIYEDYVEWGEDIHSKDKEIIEATEAIPVELRMQYGILKNLVCGVTSVAHHGAYNSCPDDSPVRVIRQGTCIHSVRLGGKWELKLNWIKNQEPYIIHTGEGINSSSYDEINKFISRNYLKRKVIGIHGIAMTEEQSSKFEALIWCPVSNMFLFNKTADISSIKKKTNILFGTDSTLTAGWNIWDHLRTARAMDHLSDEELFLSLTKEAAKIWKLENTGEISEGNTADLVIAQRKSDNLYDSFYLTEPEDIMLILKNGNVILYDETEKDKLSEFTGGGQGFSKFNINGKIKYLNYHKEKVLSEILNYNPILKDTFLN